MESKDFFQSKQTWGAILFLVAPVLENFGISIDQNAVVETITQVVGGALFLFGAFSSSRKPVGSIAGVKVKQ